MDVEGKGGESNDADGGTVSCHRKILDFDR